jgi:hypothetical protein
MMGMRATTIFRLLLITLICAGVFLQMLGAPISFWDLDGSEDDFVSSLLLGLAIPSEPAHFSTALFSLLPPHASAPARYFLDEHFHPPLSVN